MNEDNVINSSERVESYNEYIQYKRKLRYTRKSIGQFYSVNHYYEHFVKSDKSANRMFNIPKELYKEVLDSLVKAFIANLHLTGYGTLPFKAGNFVMRQFEHKPKIVDGNLVYNAPVNWNATLKLWYEDKEAEKNKVFIRVEPSVKYTAVYTSNKRNQSDNLRYYTGKMIRSVTNNINNMAKSGNPPVCLKRKSDNEQ